MTNPFGFKKNLSNHKNLNNQKSFNLNNINTRNKESNQPYNSTKS